MYSNVSSDAKSTCYLFDTSYFIAVTYKILNVLQNVIRNLLPSLNQNNLAQRLVKKWLQISNCMTQTIQNFATEKTNHYKSFCSTIPFCLGRMN